MKTLKTKKLLLALAVTALVSAAAHATPIGISWDGSGDPTTLDSNGDTINDWVVRGGGTYTGSSISGVWQGGQTLDTRPLFNFDTDFHVNMRWRSESPNDWDAAFWVNIDRMPTGFSPVYMFLKDVGSSQTLEVYGKAGASGGGTLLATYAGLADDFIVTKFAFTPASNQLIVTIDGSEKAPINYLIGTSDNSDNFATIFGGAMRLDYINFTDGSSVPPSSVPDGGATLMLLGMALSGLTLLKRKFA